MITDSSFYTVAIGTSAGGLEALIEFFKGLPADTGVCYVVVQHLLPQHRSVLAKILSRHTPLPVVEVDRDIEMRANNVYVLREGLMMTVKDGILKVRKREDSEIINRAVDIFFKSLAADFGRKAIGVVLSGMGSDGLEGVKAIEQAGGKVMVQDPDTTMFKSMPNEVIYRDNPNVILPPEHLAQSLVWFLNLNAAHLRK